MLYGFFVYFIGKYVLYVVYMLQIFNKFIFRVDEC